MSYVVLARKWRPMRFSDLVGQDHVAKTLGNAIDADRVAHAFLFTGVRGVGKTTSARILAKALNCMRAPGSREPGSPDPGPTVEPCLECAACKEIAEGRDVDVQEIDGASYNGVDEVRKLQDSLPYRPQRDRFKIVIVDEVHMLTSAAWNAFLKTLEEPPPHVKFIFATTEVHKVPITILSRVQRFDFKMIPTRLIVERLRWVLERENCSADDAALTILARQAAGSMRDAMSLLDQVIAFSGQELAGDDVARVLGVASRGALLDIARALLDGDGDSCLNRVSELSDQGFDIGHLARDLLSLLRDLVVAKVSRDPNRLLDAPDDELSMIRAMVEPKDESDLMRLYQGFSRGFDEVVRSIDPRAGLEMLLVRLAYRPALLPLDELLHRIGHLEKRLVQAGARRLTGNNPSNAPPRLRGVEPNPTPPEARRASRAPRSTGGSPEQPSRGSRDEDPEPSSPAPTAATTPLPPSTSALPADAPRDESAGVQPSPKQSSRTEQDRVPSQSSKSPELAPAASDAPARASNATSSSVTSSAPSSSAPSTAAVPSMPTGYQPSPEEQKRVDLMIEVIDELRAEDAALGAYFEQAVPLVADGTTLKLGIETGHIFETQLTSEDAKDALSRVLIKKWGPEAHLQIVRNCNDARPEGTAAAERVRRRQAAHQAAVAAVKNHPTVVEACRIFGAQIRSVQLPEGN